MSRTGCSGDLTGFWKNPDIAQQDLNSFSPLVIFPLLSLQRLTELEKQMIFKVSV